MTSDLQISNPQVHVEINRDKVCGTGAYRAAGGGCPCVCLRFAAGFLHLCFDQPVSGDPRTRPALPGRSRRRSACSISTENGQLVPLQTIATITKTIGPLAVNHLGQLPAVTISFNLAPACALGRCDEADRQACRRRLPPTVSNQFPGHRPGIQVLVQRVMAAPGHGHLRYLHCARRAL